MSLFRRLFKPNSYFLDDEGNPRTIVASNDGELASLFSSSTERNSAQLENLWKYYIGEGTVFASINYTAWNTVMAGYDILTDDDRIKMVVEEFRNRTNLDEILLNAVTFCLVFGDAFIEKIFNKSGKKLVNLKVINPITMEIIWDKYGRITGYRQTINGRKGDIIEPKYIAHFRFFPDPSTPYGVSLITPSIDTLKRKVRTDTAIASAIIRHGMPRYIITVGNEKIDAPIPEKVIDKIKSELKNITEKTEIIVPWTVKIDTIDEKGIKGVEEYFNYFQSQLVTGLMCPEEALGLGKGPLTPDMEIFVKGKGFVPITEVSEGDEILTYNADKNELEFQKNLKNWRYYINEPIYHFKGQTYDIKCTGDHRMYIRRQHHKDFEVVTADSLPSRFELMVGGFNWEGQDLEEFVLPAVEKYVGDRWHNSKIKVGEYSEKRFDIDDWLEFFGYFLSEGSTVADSKEGYEVKIKQCSQNGLDIIESVVKRLGFKYSRYDDSIRIFDKQLAVYLHQFGKSYERYIPDWIKNLPPKRLKVLYDALMFGDGSGKNFFTSSKHLADDVQEILLKMGYGSTVYTRDRINQPVIINGERVGTTRHLQYVVTRNEHNLTPEVCIKTTSHHPSTLALEDYSGWVYCVTVPNGLILTRHNGKVSVVGNSTEAVAYVKALLYERMIKAFQLRLKTFLLNEIFKPLLEGEGLDSSKLNIVWRSVTDEDEAMKAKWLGNLLRGFRDKPFPFTINEIRSMFGFEPIDEEELNDEA